MNLRLIFLTAYTLFLTISCGTDHAGRDNHDHDHAQTIAMSIWTEELEIFAECDPPVAGEPFHVLIHLTDMNSFKPLPVDNNIRIVFKPNTASDVVVEAIGLQDGIFKAEFTINQSGQGTLLLEVPHGGHRHRTSIGTIKIGTENHPGHLLSTPRHDRTPLISHDHDHAETEDEHDHDTDSTALYHKTDHQHDNHDHGIGETGSGIPFLKEQQWAMDFKTSRVQTGSLPHGLSAFGKIQARSGYDIVLTAPVDGIVTAASWPTGGMHTTEDQVLFHLVPRVSDAFSLTGLQATVSELSNRHDLAAGQLERLERLLASGTVSRWAVEEARVRTQALQHQLKAAKTDLETARSLRKQSKGRVEKLPVRSPFPGQVVHVRVTPGQFISAGTELIHIVQERPIQLELAIPVQQTHLINEPIRGLYLRSFVDSKRVFVDQQDLHLIARTPGVDPDTGKVTLNLEVNRSLNRFPLHAVVEAELLLEGHWNGIVIPTSALIDDAGNPVVYCQLSGEAFSRTPVRVLQRRGNDVLVSGLHEGDRIVVRGGQSIRRAEMVGSGSFSDHGHSH